MCVPVSVCCGRYTDRLLRMVMEECVRVCCGKELMCPGFMFTHDETLAPREKHTPRPGNTQIITHPTSTAFISIIFIIFIMSFLVVTGSIKHTIIIMTSLCLTDISCVYISVFVTSYCYLHIYMFASGFA